MALAVALYNSFAGGRFGSLNVNMGWSIVVWVSLGAWELKSFSVHVSLQSMLFLSLHCFISSLVSFYGVSLWIVHDLYELMRA